MAAPPSAIALLRELFGLLWGWWVHPPTCPRPYSRPPAGFEFSGASKVCALWNRTPQATAQKSGATCYVKLVTGPEATAELQNGQGGSSSAITSILLMALGFGLGVGLILVAQYFALQRARTADSSNFRQQHSQSLLMGNIGSAEGGGDAADGPPASPPDGSQGDVQLEGGRGA